MIKHNTLAIYYQSLNRPILMLGVDRSLFFLNVGLCLPIAFSGHFVVLMDIIAITCFLSGYCIGLLMTRADPDMLALYKRHIRYLKYYSAQPGIHAKPILIRPSVPVYIGQRGII